MRTFELSLQIKFYVCRYSGIIVWVWLNSYLMNGMEQNKKGVEMPKYISSTHTHTQRMATENSKLKMLNLQIKVHQIQMKYYFLCANARFQRHTLWCVSCSVCRVLLLWKKTFPFVAVKPNVICSEFSFWVDTPQWWWCRCARMFVFVSSNKHI